MGESETNQKDKMKRPRAKSSGGLWPTLPSQPDQ